jgi:hypothetical protein
MRREFGRGRSKQGVQTSGSNVNVPKKSEYDSEGIRRERGQRPRKYP